MWSVCVILKSPGFNTYRNIGKYSKLVTLNEYVRVEGATKESKNIGKHDI